MALRESTPGQSQLPDRVRYFSHDAEGGILRRREGTLDSNDVFKQSAAETLRDTYYTYGNGQQVARQVVDGEFSVAGGPSQADSVAPQALGALGSLARLGLLRGLSGQGYGLSARDAALLSEKAKQDRDQAKRIAKGQLDAPEAAEVWTGYGGRGQGVRKVQVLAGESLRNVAQRVYGNASLWSP